MRNKSIEEKIIYVEIHIDNDMNALLCNGRRKTTLGVDIIVSWALSDNEVVCSIHKIMVDLFIKFQWTTVNVYLMM